MTPAIRVQHLSKRYTRYAQRRRFSTLKSAILHGSLLTELTPETTFQALEDVSFAIEKGSTVAIVGPNGSGKSTLLKVLAGILRPTKGTVDVDGRVAALLELGAGFHPEISGRENIIINGIMLGLPRREIERRIPEIIRFADLEAFIDAPVKTYSSGMYVRLGFSVAIAVEPDVLMVDEVLAVGDEEFSHKCIDRFRDLKRRGRTVLLVTHALELAAGLADVAILLENGRLSIQGLPREVIDRYRGHVAAREAAGTTAVSVSAEAADEAASVAEDDEDGSPASAQLDVWRPRRWGNGVVELARVALLDASGFERSLFQTGEAATIEIEVVASAPQSDFVFGIALWTRDGHLAYGTNTDIERYRSKQLAGRGKVRIELPTLPLIEGSYALDVAVHSRHGVAFDYRRACLELVLRSDVKDQGIARLSHRWVFSDNIELERTDEPSLNPPSEPGTPARPHSCPDTAQQDP